jgi:hypothetical protein
VITAEHIRAAVEVAAPEPVVSVEVPPARMPNPLEQFGGRFSHQPETPVAPARPRFAELSEPASYTPLPRDYAPEMHSPASLTAAPVFNHPSEPDDTDLDVPAFLRRGQF